MKPKREFEEEKEQCNAANSVAENEHNTYQVYLYKQLVLVRPRIYFIFRMILTFIAMDA